LIALSRPIYSQQAAILSTTAANDHDTITLHYNLQIADQASKACYFKSK